MTGSIAAGGGAVELEDRARRRLDFQGEGGVGAQGGGEAAQVDGDLGQLAGFQHVVAIVLADPGHVPGDLVLDLRRVTVADHDHVLEGRRGGGVIGGQVDGVAAGDQGQVEGDVVDGGGRGWQSCPWR